MLHEPNCSPLLDCRTGYALPIGAHQLKHGFLTLRANHFPIFPRFITNTPDDGAQFLRSGIETMTLRKMTLPRRRCHRYATV